MPALMENKPPRKSVYAVRVGETGFRVEKTTNYLDLKVGSTISKEDAQKLIDSGITVSIGRNK